MAKNFSPQLMKSISGYMDSHSIHYTTDSEKGLLRAAFRLDCKLKDYKLIVDLYNCYYIVYCTLNISADEGCRREAAEFLIRANRKMGLGNFEMDMRDGEIRFKCMVDCDDCPPSEDVISSSLTLGDTYLERFGDALLSVLFGFATPEAAIAACSK